MTNKHKLFRIGVVALAAVWLVFGLSTPSDAGWLKKAKKAAKKAAHSVEKAVRDQAQRSAADVSRAAKKAGGDISRESKRFGGDISRETKRFTGDVSREGKRFAGDISREGKKFGVDINREFNKGLPAISMENLGKGLAQLEHNKHLGFRRLEDNANRGAGNLLINLTGNRDIGTLYGDLSSPWHYLTPKVGAILVMAPFFPLTNTRFMENLEGGLGRLGDNVEGGLRKIGIGATQAGDSNRDEHGRADALIFASPKEVGSDKADTGGRSGPESSKEVLTKGTNTGLEESSSPATASAKKGKTKISAQDVSDPVAIFRAETDTGMTESSGASSTVFKERTSTTSLGTSTGSSSGSSEMGSSQTMGKKESTSPMSSGGPKSGDMTGRRK